jgi:hypothetical protein
VTTQRLPTTCTSFSRKLPPPSTAGLKKLPPRDKGNKSWNPRGENARAWQWNASPNGHLPKTLGSILRSPPHTPDLLQILLLILRQILLMLLHNLLHLCTHQTITNAGRRASVFVSGGDQDQRNGAGPATTGLGIFHALQSWGGRANVASAWLRRLLVILNSNTVWEGPVAPTSTALLASVENDCVCPY